MRYFIKLWLNKNILFYVLLKLFDSLLNFYSVNFNYMYLNLKVKIIYFFTTYVIFLKVQMFFKNGTTFIEANVYKDNR